MANDFAKLPLDLEDKLKQMEDFTTVTKEKGERLSRSVIMKSHDLFYQTLGPHAWKIIPDYISTNSFIAGTYGKLIINYVKDLILNNALNPPSDTNILDFWVIEIGSGTGGLGYLITRYLLQNTDTIPPIKINNKKYTLQLHYVLTVFNFVKIYNLNHKINFGFFLNFFEFFLNLLKKRIMWKRM